VLWRRKRLLSAQRHAPLPRPRRPWLAGHKQGLAYGLVAASIAVVIGAAAIGGVHLRRSAVIERQTLRIQQLGGLAFQLQDFLSQAQAMGRVGEGLAARRTQALTAANTSFRLVRAHDRAAGDRLGPAYAAFIRTSSRAFEKARTDNGQVPAAQQRQVERRLTRFESRVDSEIARQAEATSVTNPRARLALIVAAAAAALLIGVLIWQFEMQRRAGRIDRDTAERSEELVRLRDDFAAAVSHELRTPLTSILGYLELIRDNDSGQRSPDDEAYLAVVQRNAERLLALVSDLLLVAEVEDRVLALQIEEVDLGELATECAEAAKPAADAKRIRLTLQRELRDRFEGDPIRLAQMMDNLVSNAIKFTPAGGEVTITTAARDGHALFQVSDSGPGISVADQAHLFDRFFRTREAAEQATTGTGLGLTITKAIVDAHGGSIHVTSAVGMGTTFRVQLPHSHADAESPAAEERSALPHS
jgi:signal transduction histidine kinase